MFRFVSYLNEVVYDVTFLIEGYDIDNSRIILRLFNFAYYHKSRNYTSVEKNGVPRTFLNLNQNILI